MSTYRLPFHKALLQINLLDKLNIKTLAPKPVHILDDPGSALMFNLESPVGGTAFGELAASTKGNILIVIPDHTRVCLKDMVVTWLVDLLNSLGIDDKRIKVLVALGTHNKPPMDQFIESVGPTHDRVEFIQHDIEGKMADFGVTSRGTPVKVNALINDADLLILYSSVVHHYFAGFGGGRKLICPGIASFDTIKANHSLVFEGSGPDGGRNPNVCAGQIDGNPVHEDMLECAKLVLDGKRYISVVSVVTGGKELAYFAAGDIDGSHERAREFVETHNTVDIPEQADLVLASAGGWPKDSNLIQSHKGMDNAIHALKPGGTLLYVMSCSEGYGHSTIDPFVPLDLDGVRRKLAEDYVIYGQTIYAIKEKARDFNIVCYSYLEQDVLGQFGFTPATDLEDGISKIKNELYNAGLIYHLPRADLVVPRLK